MSYLGRISAIVSVNNSEVAPRLNASANEVQRFARTVQSNLTSASTAAGRSFDGIWTRLQRMENSLAAARSMPLSFRGFDGAVATIDGLNRRIAELSRRQVNISVAGTGFRDLAEMQRMLAGIRDSDVQTVRRLGGLEYARANRELLLPREEESLRRFDGLPNNGLEQIDRAVEVMGGRFFEQAARNMRLLASAAADVGQPMAAAVQRFESLSLELQGRFSPAMNAAAERAQNLRDAITNAPERVTAGWIGQLAGMVERTTAALDRLAEAEAAARSLSSGSELRFRNPGLAEALEAAGRNDAAFGQLSPGRAAALGVGDRAFATRRAAEEAVRAAGATENARLTGDVIQIQRAVELEQTRLALLRSENEINEQLLAQEQARTNEAAEAAEESRRRAEVASALLNVLQEESTLISNEGVAQDITAYLQQLEEARARTEQLEEATRRAQVASALLNVLQDESNIVSNEGSGTPLGPRYFGDLSERGARRRMGGDIPGGPGEQGARLDIGRQVDGVINRVADARRQIDTLPDPIRAGLIPALQSATDAAANLARSGFGATATQIRTAAREAERLSMQVNRARRSENFTGQFGRMAGGGLDFSLQERSLQGYTAQLQILHQTLAVAGSAARGPASAAFDRLRSYISRAFRDGRLDAELTRGEIQRLTQEAVQATAAVAGVRAGTLGRQVARAGDVGRMGFNNAGLAIQQASFAVSDFMSATGGIEFKIRAISNNIEQLGFVLGGTFGLVAAVGVSLVTNLGLMAARFVGLMDTEEQVRSRTDAVSDAFERQKNAVDDLAESYSRYSDELRKTILSKEENLAIDRREEAAGTLKKQQESRDAFASVTLPQMLVLQAQRKKIEARSPATLQEAQAKQADLAANDARQQRELEANRARGQDALRRLGPAGVNLLLNQQLANRENLLRQRAAPGADIADIDARIARANQNIALASDALSGLRGEAVAVVRAGTDPIRDSIEKAMASAEKLREEFGDLVPDETMAELANAASELQKLVDQTQAGGFLPGAGLNKMIADIASQANAPIERIRAAGGLVEQRRLMDENANAVAQEIAQSAQRGGELGLSPQEKAGRELAEGLLDIARSRANPADAQRAFINERLRAAAPDIFGMADQVENAIVQGPSRAALQATDVSTSQGAAELNRLLRGDDSAKDQNLVELQKQSKSLDDLVTIARENAGVGVW